MTNTKKSIIKVLGIGGGGSNAVNYMYRLGIQGVDFAIFNTDIQALDISPVQTKIQLGIKLTQGLGAGNVPEKGENSAIENISEIENIISGTEMVFITAGMGGGTGTGAAPVIANHAKQKGILTIGIVTLPFAFEGKRRIKQAVDGINKIKDVVDSLIVINNEKLREIYGNIPISQAFEKADNVLATAARSISEIITVHGYVNVDFADVRTVLKNSGVAIMGSGTGEGEERAEKAVIASLNSPLLDNNSIKGAKNILLNIISGTEEVTMDEITNITDFLHREGGKQVNIIWGNSKDETLGKKIGITLIATGFSTNAISEVEVQNKMKKTIYNLNEETIITQKNVIEKVENNAFKSEINVKYPTSETKQFFENEINVGIKEIEPVLKTQPIIKQAEKKDSFDSDGFENVSAYKRKGKKSDENLNIRQFSSYTIDEEEDSIVVRNNSFIHDKRD